MIEFNLLGQIPSGKNAIKITRAGHRYPSKRFSKWRELVRFMVPEVPQPLDKQHELSITIIYYAGNLIRRDVPGMIDALFHLFEYCGLVEDDARFKNVTWVDGGLDRARPRCEIQIQERKNV